MTIPDLATAPSCPPAVPGRADMDRQGSGASIALAYLVHDLADAAVRRRVELFALAGADVALAGFHRTPQPRCRIADRKALPLGRTRNGALLARMGSVLRHWLAPRQVRRVTEHGRVIVARNLEMLVLAARVRKPGQRLVYECLDIHRLLLGRGPLSHLLRAVEKRAMRGVDLVVVSAPAFRDRYFRERRRWPGEIALIENRVPCAGSPPQNAHCPPAVPWRIGWFGMLRCRRSLDMLARLAAARPGKVEVLIAGRPSPDIFPDFETEIARIPGLAFAGSYRPRDLPELYGRVHFAWSIDYFEDGLNSAWLLPNRLYESLAHGAVPIALAGVATGEWLARHRAGVLIEDPLRDLLALFGSLSAESFGRLRERATRIPRSAVVMDSHCAQTIGRLVMGLA